MIFRSLAGTFAFAGLLLNSGCDRAKTSSGQAPAAAPAASAPALAPSIPGASPHFARVMGKLDVGAKKLQYSDHEGQRESIAGIVEMVLEKMPASPGLRGIDPLGLVDASGLAASAASGHSLRKDGDAWLLRRYSYMPEGPRGLSSLLGKEPVAFRSPALLPAATDLVVETRLDARALPGLLRSIAASAGKTREAEAFLKEPLPIGGSVQGICEKTDLQVILGIDISSWQANPVSPQPVDFYLQVDGAGELLRPLLPELEKGLGKSAAHGSRRGWTVPVAAFQQAQALLLYDEEGSLVFTSRADYLKYVETAEMKLGQWKEFKGATDHFPKSGNFLCYASPQVPAALAWLLKRSAGAVEEEAGPVLDIAAGFLVAKPWSFCVASEPDGMVSTGELPFLLDSNGTLPVLTGTSVLFIGARAWKKGSDRAACIMNIRNAQMAVRGYQQITGAGSGSPLDWDKEIFGKNGTMKEAMMKRPVCPAGGTYVFSESVPRPGQLACTCSHADHKPAQHEDW